MKVCITTYGCRANQADSEAVRASILASGGEIVDAPELADAVVLNSCAVTAAAEADLRRGARHAARVKPGVRTVVMGCAAALDTGVIAALPGVAGVVGGADVPAVLVALGLPSRGEARVAQTGTRAFLRIQDGCDEHCTFCATRIARGRARSRTLDAIVADAGALAVYHPEIVLTGVHIGSYGVDLGSTLSHLVERLMRDVPAVRFRLSSLEATEVDDRLAAVLVEQASERTPRLAPALHAPLQSGSDQVLRRMGRSWYTARTYAAAVERLVSGSAVFGLSADVMCGFPGETPADHAATVSLIEALPFTSLHVFPYSPRPGTAALHLARAVNQRLIAERAAEVRSLAARKAATYAASRGGTDADVIVLAGDRARAGITEDGLTVSVARLGLARGARTRARLELEGGALFAHATAA